MFIGTCIIAIVDERKTSLMTLAILFHLLCAQHVSDINISIFRSLLVFVLKASACNTNTTQHQPHQISNTQRTENKTTDVVIHQHSRKLLKMDILTSETCWAHNKWNKIASVIKLVFHSSTFTQIGTWHRLHFSRPSVCTICQSITFLTFTNTITTAATLMSATQAQTMTQQSTHSPRD